MAANGPSVIMDPMAMEKALIRMAHEIWERNRAEGDKLLILGIPARGDILAKRIAGFMEKDAGKPVPCGILDITFYRDDVGSKASKPKKSDIPVPVDGKIIVLVDDVLFTGRSVRAAMDALVDLGRPKAIQLAVLVDRGHREVPIKADFVGKNVPTQENTTVKVTLKETDGTEAVVLEGLQ
jgi:pyrimidine operon attenuation protein/uracil phosphoribosyltransferase